MMDVSAHDMLTVEICKAWSCPEEAVRDGFCSEHAARVANLSPHERTNWHDWPRTAILEAVARWTAQNGRPPTSHQWNTRADGWPTYHDVRRHFNAWHDLMHAAGFRYYNGAYLPGPGTVRADPIPAPAVAAAAEAGVSSPSEPPNPAADPVPEPPAEPEPVDWRHHPDLVWEDLGPDDPVDFLATALEFGEAVQQAERAIRRLRAAHAAIQAFSDPLVARANALLTGEDV